MTTAILTYSTLRSQHPSAVQRRYGENSNVINANNLQTVTKHIWLNTSDVITWDLYFTEMNISVSVYVPLFGCDCICIITSIHYRCICIVIIG